MTILNFLWGFSTGGVGKCFLTYDKLGDVEPDLKVISVCVVTAGIDWDLQPLYKQNIKVVSIRNRRDFSWMQEIKSIVDNNIIDFFFCHGHNGPVMLTLFNWRYRTHIPFICTCHGYNGFYSFMSKIYAKMILRVWRGKNVKKLICVERYTPQQLERLGVAKYKMVTVYNGIVKEIETKPLDLSEWCSPEVPVIVTTSRLTKLKGLDYLMPALKKVKDAGFSFHCFCVGDGEEEGPLNQQCVELGISENVSFMGYQNNIPDWLSACDIFAFPSLEEAHSIAILEAMRAKKAIVATNIGGNPESIRDEIDALMVPSKDSEELALALTRLLSDSELREKLSSSANKRFKDMFTIDIMMNNLAREIITTSK